MLELESAGFRGELLFPGSSSAENEGRARLSLAQTYSFFTLALLALQRETAALNPSLSPSPLPLLRNALDWAPERRR